jgi:murein DD-endopeptidase MepM/ murein hydrolase activator NlpD
MQEKLSRKQQILEKLKNKYRFVILDEDTYEEKAIFRLNRLSVLVSVSTFLVLLTIGIVALIAFTPLREYIPGYADVNMSRNIRKMYNRVDSLEEAMEDRDAYIEMIQDVVKGDFDDRRTTKAEANDSIYDPSIMDNKQANEKKLRENLEAQNVDVALGIGSENDGLRRIAFFKQPFDARTQRYYATISTQQNQPIHAILDGTVIMATYSIETGYTIGIQHRNNIVSFYKNCVGLLKKNSNFVKSGETIATAGTTNPNTTPTLRLELWYNGIALNPADYINFKK